jgi:photosystem II stability/assembly factor-like uncharacterized protein
VLCAAAGPTPTLRTAPRLPAPQPTAAHPPPPPPLPPRSFLDDKVGYACGGSGSLFKSDDGGASWKRDKSTDDVAGNLYAIKFFPGNLGFILGNNGILLRYIKQ